MFTFQYSFGSQGWQRCLPQEEQICGRYSKPLACCGPHCQAEGDSSGVLALLAGASPGTREGACLLPWRLLLGAPRGRRQVPPTLWHKGLLFPPAQLWVSLRGCGLSASPRQVPPGSDSHLSVWRGLQFLRGATVKGSHVLFTFSSPPA